jgi:ankyrin repeat protein
MPILPDAPSIFLLLLTLWLLIIIFTLYITVMKRGSTALHRACSAGKLEKVQAILTASPNRLNEPDRFGISPIQYAAGWGRVPVLEYLITKGANINQAPKGWTPLTLACAAGHQAAFDLLLQHNADPNAVGPAQPVYPLHAAVNHGRIQMAQALLARGANVNQQGEKQITPLHLAAWRSHAALIQILLEHDADKSAKDNEGLTPRDYAKQERGGKAQEMLE